MPSATRTIAINRPPEEVFAFIADGTTAPRWRSSVLDIRQVSGNGVGAVYRQGVKGPGGRRIAADYRVTAVDPPNRLAFLAIAGPVRPEGRYTLERSAGGTRLTFHLEARLRFPMSLLMGRAVQSTMNAEMAALDRLKAVIEATPAG